jgi:Tfp pilus assembly protein PilO
MVLAKREKILAAITGGLLLLAVGWSALGGFSGAVQERRAQIDALGKDVEKKAQRAAAIEALRKQATQWNRHALPSNVETARLLYQNWLLELVDRSKFKGKKVEAGAARPHRGAYTTLPFAVQGQANLEQLTQFLFEFYSAGHLHQIRRLTLKPQEKTSDLGVTLLIEAISLPGADRPDKLSTEPMKRLAAGDLAGYQRAIAGRDFFAAYAPPRPPVAAEKRPEPPPSPPPFDHSKYIFVTAITEQDGKPQVWLKARTTDEKFTLREGEKFRVGAVEGKVVRIGQREVEIEIDGKARVVPLGASLGKAPDAPRS